MKWSDVNVTSYLSQGKRDNQEDSIIHFENDDWLVVGVADGLGGHFAGEFASDAVKRSFSCAPSEFVNQWIIDCLWAADRECKAYSKEHKVFYRGSASTLALGVFDKKANLVYTCNVGDSFIIQRDQNSMWSQVHESDEDESGGLTHCIGLLAHNYRPEIKEHFFKDFSHFIFATDGVEKLLNKVFLTRGRDFKHAEDIGLMVEEFDDSRQDNTAIVTVCNIPRFQ